MAFADFEIVTTSTGAVSIKNKIVNEIMHNPVGPWKEANDLYIQQSRLIDRLIKQSTGEPVVLFDVGLGAATNAVAVLHCAADLMATVSGARSLSIVSFESDLSLLEFAWQHREHFPYLERFGSSIRSILDQGFWNSDDLKITWQLRAGDFRQTITTESTVPELIFFDPYSPGKNQEMWTLACFQDVFRLLAKSEEPGLLLTYSMATPIRAAMLMAGFYVGFGSSTGLKEETTQAAARSGILAHLLDERWFRRWSASHRAMPFDVDHFDEALLRNAIISHPQFKQGQQFSSPSLVCFARKSLRRSTRI